MGGLHTPLKFVSGMLSFSHLLELNGTESAGAMG
jgi:hypothetical protein